MGRLVKPCSALTAEDFSSHPIWGFDLSQEGEPGTDESWVRPFQFASVPACSDGLFVAANVKPGDHPPQHGAVSLRFENATPMIEACVLLEPAYCAVPMPPSAMRPALLRAMLNWALGVDFMHYFPITFESSITVGDLRFPLHGTIALPDLLREE
jgi:hypothetical protein